MQLPFVPREEIHHLDGIFWRYGIKDPTWCRWIVERISRRRWVSVREIHERIIPWYAQKHHYPERLLRQHGFKDWLPMDSGYPVQMRGEEWGPFSPLPSRMDKPFDMRCFLCWAIVPSGEGHCGIGLCAEVWEWLISRQHRHHGRPVSGDRELWGLYVITRYLKWLITTQHKR